MKKHSGFTLIELMVVMAIIAILATAGLTAYSNYLKKARDSARAQTARALMTKVEELANGGLAPTPGELKAFLKAENFAPAIDADSGPGEDWRFDIEPLNQDAKTCWEDDGGTYAGKCVFVYGKIHNDNTYFIIYPVEHPDNRTNIGSVYYGGFNNYVIAGNMIGTNPNLTNVNGSDGYLFQYNLLYYIWGDSTNIEYAYLTSEDIGV